VITRAVKAMIELQSLGKQYKKAKNILFIAYHPASYPVMESQGFAYIRGLSKKNVRYSLLTFETKETKGNSKKCISELNIPIKWSYLTYHQKPRFLATCFDIACGILTVALMVKKDKVEIIHARGFIAALIAFLPAKSFGTKFFFDTRGLLADKYVCGGLLTKDSFTYRLMRWGEDLLIGKSDCFTVETFKHAKIINNLQNDIHTKMYVIPCCIDTNKFNYLLYPKRLNNNERFTLVYLGKVGTWYLLKEMLDFFKVLNEEITYSHFAFFTESKVEYLYSTVKANKIDESKVTVRKAKMSEVPGLLSCANVGIYFMNPYKQYSFSPIKFGEYLACGLPVIINTGIGDCDEIVLKENVGVVINKFSSDEFKRGIRELKVLLSEGDTLKERCKATAEKYFSLEMGVERYMNIYKRLGKEWL
jgi:glycosyltransferase involved in cell wall biosynthesis